jgi:DNA-binding response OmpR family regulator
VSQLSKITVLLIEDDSRIRVLLPRYFEREQIEMLTASTGQVGLEQLEEKQPDLVLLDVNLPDIDGWSILRRIRQGSNPDQPVLMLTGRSDVPDRLMGLDLGADDYIVKPFEPLEVIARVKAVLRRAKRPPKAPDELLFPGLRIDLVGFSVWRDEQPLSLTAKEFAVLAALAQNSGRVLTRQRLYDLAWGEESFGDDHTLDVTMNRLRQKLVAEDGYQYITTVRGIGYKFEVRKDG